MTQNQSAREAVERLMDHGHVVPFEHCRLVDQRDLDTVLEALRLSSGGQVHSVDSGAFIPTEGEEWTVGQHPAVSNGWIVRPVLFGSRVRVLPEHEGGHVLLKSEADAKLIAAAPRMRQLLHEVSRAYDGFEDGDGEMCPTLIAVRYLLSEIEPTEPAKALLGTKERSDGVNHPQQQGEKP